MSNIQPLVTIYIPTYNRLELLKRAVKSVQEQTYRNLEIIIVDDCSTDGTQDYLIQLAQQDQRIRYFFKEKNSGACVSRNIAIENATGEFITGLDDDDYFFRERIEKFILNKELLNYYSFIFSENYIEINGEYKFSDFYKLKPKIVKANDLLFSNIIGNQCFTKTKRMALYGKFSKNLTAWQDMDVWYRFLKLEKNHKAYKIKNQTYVQDISHELGRISTSNKKNKILNVYDNFCNINKLSSLDKKILKGHLVSYDIYISYIDLFIRFFLKFNIYIFLKNFHLIFKNLKNKKK